MNLKTYSRLIETRLTKSVLTIKPLSLQRPIAHVVEAGGKRLRPIIALLACEAAGGKAHDALDAAVAVELLHTFTLVHDDIMDNAALRRGRATVHTKWDSHTAILAGDTIAALAMQSMVKRSHSRMADITAIFSKAFVDVCVGQAVDRELEHSRTVDMPSYLKMIGLKTAAMFSASAAIGGCIGSGNAKRVRALTTFGRELGMAFQIRDDALDVAADPKHFGKDAGGDIREGKKAFLFVAARSVVRTKNDRALLNKYAKNKGLRGDDVTRVFELYHRGALQLAERAIEARTKKAIGALHMLPLSAARATLEELAITMTSRTF